KPCKIKSRRDRVPTGAKQGKQLHEPDTLDLRVACARHCSRSDRNNVPAAKPAIQPPAPHTCNGIMLWRRLLSAFACTAHHASRGCLCHLERPWHRLDLACRPCLSRTEAGPSSHNRHHSYRCGRTGRKSVLSFNPPLKNRRAFTRRSISCVIENDQLSRKLRSFLERLGCFSFLSALASI